MHRNHKFLTLAAGLLGLIGASSAAHAALLTIDVRAVSTTIGGQTTEVTDAKNVSVTSVGESVNFNIYAEIANSDGNHANDNLTSLSTKFVSTETSTGLLGDISGVAKTQTFNTGSNGSQNNLDSNAGDKEWGGTSTTSTSGNFNPFANPVATSTTGGDGETEILLGTMVWTLSGNLTDGSTTVINSLPYVNSVTQKGAYTFVSDGITYANRNNSDLGAGLGVTITGVVPEPTSMSLIGLVGTGLLARRRRQRTA